MSRLGRVRGTIVDVVDVLRMIPEGVRAVRSVVELVMRPTPKPLPFARRHVWLDGLTLAVGTDPETVRCMYCGTPRTSLNVEGPCDGPSLAHRR